MIGRGVTWPVRAAWDAVAGPPSDPIATFQQRERAAIVLAVEKLLDELERLAQVGNDTLRPRLQQLLGGHARASLLARVQIAHENLPAVDEHYQAFLRAELDAWRRSNPRAVRFLQSLDHAAAVARPAITVASVLHRPAFCGRFGGPSGRAGRRRNGRPPRHRSGHRRRHHRRRRSDRQHHQRRRSPSRRPIVRSAPIPLRPATGRVAGQLAGTRTARRSAWPIFAAGRKWSIVRHSVKSRRS